MKGWFRQGKTTCPLTGVKLTSIQLTTNFALRNAIQSWKRKQVAASSSGEQNGSTSYPTVQVQFHIDALKIESRAFESRL